MTNKKPSKSNRPKPRRTQQRTIDAAKLKEIETSEESKSLLEDRMEVLNQILGFKHFLGSSFEPQISDSEIVVCFADIRGFTAYCRSLQKEMQDRKIQNFLRTYIKIFNEGLMSWFVDTSEQDYGDEIEIKEISKYVVPTMYKNLGDGLMMVWEIPPLMDLTVQGKLSHHIILLIMKMRERFYFHFRDLSPVELDSYSEEVTKLEIGFGVAKGHAWRLDFGHSLDYAGSIINLASRLESLARPRGIVSQYDVSNWLFDNMVKEKSGHLVRLSSLKGYGPGVTVWINQDISPSQKGFTIIR